MLIIFFVIWIAVGLAAWLLVTIREGFYGSEDIALFGVSAFLGPFAWVALVRIYMDFDPLLICDNCGKSESWLKFFFPKRYRFPTHGGQAGFYDYCSQLCEDLHSDENWSKP